jgi:adenosylcobinamide-phosphate synthase
MIETALLLVLALALDAIFGEPKWLWSRAPHPAVLMGRLIEWMDQRFNEGEEQRWRGVLCVGALVVGAGVLGLILQALPFGWLISVILTAILLAQRSLVDHVTEVANGLRYGLPAGKRAVAKIVGRDTNDMDEADVARAAIESAAENFSDGVIAPAFWFLILGLPGLLIYKIINTADSMIGYRTPRHEAFGWAAAKLDDVLNWAPARLSAILIAGVHRSWDAWRTTLTDAGLHRSPNAGWPEAAMAGILGIALSGPRSYDGEMRNFPYANAAGARDVGEDEIDHAVAALWKAWLAFVGLILILVFFWALAA